MWQPGMRGSYGAAPLFLKSIGRNRRRYAAPTSARAAGRSASGEEIEIRQQTRRPQSLTVCNAHYDPYG